MTKPTLYKSVPLGDINNKVTIPLTAEETTAAQNTVAKFFELFAAKHT